MLENISRHLLPLKKGITGVVVIVPLDKELTAFKLKNDTSGFIKLIMPEGDTASKVANDFSKSHLSGVVVFPMYCSHLVVKSAIIGAPDKYIQEFCFIVDAKTIPKFEGLVEGLKPLEFDEFTRRVYDNVMQVQGE